VRLEAAFPEAEVLRVMPNLGVEVRKGVLCVAGSATGEVRGKLDLLGHVVEIADADFDAATAVMGCAPAYLALAVEAIADAGADDGLDPDLALELTVETAVGTEAGLEALDREDARGVFAAAVRASLERMRG
jgi:pyrroline-5-carboxylate reductase